MGREQGDELPTDPTMYVSPDGGEERAAHSPADEVNLKARGWVRQEATAGRRAGRPRPAPRPAAEATAASTQGSDD